VTKISALRTVTTYRFLIVKSKKLVVFKDDINSTEDPEAGHGLWLLFGTLRFGKTNNDTRYKSNSFDFDEIGCLLSWHWQYRRSI